GRTRELSRARAIGEAFDRVSARCVPIDPVRASAPLARSVDCTGTCFMTLGVFFLKDVDHRGRVKGIVLASWFFLTVATLWLLKPVRVASLLAHLGAAETPYVRLAAVATIAIVVGVYSIFVNRLTRIGVVRWANVLFAVVLLLFWLAMKTWGSWLGNQRAFVWAVYILVEIYSAIIIGVFWTYTNDVVTNDEANKLYGFIGLGGIVGGIAGGAFVDAFARRIGSSNLLLVCAGLVAASIALATHADGLIHPPERHPEHRAKRGLARALAGAMEVRKSRYLVLIVGIVVAYEISATMADFG